MFSYHKVLLTNIRFTFRRESTTRYSLCSVISLQCSSSKFFSFQRIFVEQIQVDLVILTSPPQDWESYVHRSDRTGRQGKVISIYNQQQIKQLKLVQQKAVRRLHFLFFFFYQIHFYFKIFNSSKFLRFNSILMKNNNNNEYRDENKID